MELLIVLGFGLFMLGKWIYDKLTTNQHAFTSEELEAMTNEMIGKSQKECREIIKKYSK